MSSKEIIRNVLKLSPKEKLLIVDSILKSLDKPDKDIEKIWLDESKKRLKFFRVGKLKGVHIKLSIGKLLKKIFNYNTISKLRLKPFFIFLLFHEISPLCGIPFTRKISWQFFEKLNVIATIFSRRDAIDKIVDCNGFQV